MVIVLPRLRGSSCFRRSLFWPRETRPQLLFVHSYCGPIRDPIGGYQPAFLLRASGSAARPRPPQHRTTHALVRGRRTPHPRAASPVLGPLDIYRSTHGLCTDDHATTTMRYYVSSIGHPSLAGPTRFVCPRRLPYSGTGTTPSCAQRRRRVVSGRVEHVRGGLGPGRRHQSRLTPREHTTSAYIIRPCDRKANITLTLKKQYMSMFVDRVRALVRARVLAHARVCAGVLLRDSAANDCVCAPCARQRVCAGACVGVHALP
jgi:hypothetical protein